MSWGWKRFFSFNTADRITALVVILLGLGLLLLFAGNRLRSGIPGHSNTFPNPDSLLEKDSAVDRVPMILYSSDSTAESSPKFPNDQQKVSEHLERSKDYVGPPKYPSYSPKRRIPEGATLELNRADSAMLTMVPGIGASFARRIVSLRERLGGYYTVLQLQEVYGMTPDRYRQIKPYFTVGVPPERVNISEIPFDSIPRHPYLSYEQKNALQRILFRDGKIKGWDQLLSLECFTRDDSVRLSHYFVFE